jgi:hypothetical protein
VTDSTQQQLMSQLIELTDAVKALAVRSATDSDRVSDADLVRQRVTFSYQALGTLTGRVSSATGREFDIRVVAATRRRGFVIFEGLPAAADWVELRDGGKVEVLRIIRASDLDDAGGEPSPVPADLRHRRRDAGVAHPRRFRDNDPIGSMVFLRARRGPLIAFGPRLPPINFGTYFADTVPADTVLTDPGFADFADTDLADTGRTGTDIAATAHPATDPTGADLGAVDTD